MQNRGEEPAPVKAAVAAPMPAATVVALVELSNQLLQVWLLRVDLSLGLGELATVAD